MSHIGHQGFEMPLRCGYLTCIIHEHYEKVRQSVCDISSFMNNAG
jgi:hypothetical protein